MPTLSRPGLIEDEGFILAKEPLGEDSFLVFYLSRNLGKWEGVAKRARKSLRRFGGGLEPFCLLDIACRMAKVKPGAYFLEKSKPKVYFEGVLKNEPRAMAGFIANEMLLSSHLETHEAKTAYSLYSILLGALESAKYPLEDLLGFLEAFSRLIGVEPRLDTCLSCGVTLGPQSRAGLSILEGGAVCWDCMARQRRWLGHTMPLRIPGDTGQMIRFYLEHWQYRFDKELLSPRVYRHLLKG